MKANLLSIGMPVLFLLVACTAPPTAEAPEPGPIVMLHDAEVDALLAEADTFYAVGDLLIEEHDIRDTLGNVMFHITETMQPIHVQWPGDQPVGLQRDQRQGTVSTSSDDNGQIRCTLTCQEFMDGAPCTHRGCTPNGLLCTNGSCQGGCRTVDCKKTFIGHGKKGVSIQ